MQALAAQPCPLPGLCGDGHQLGGVTRIAGSWPIGLRAEHVEAATLMAEQTRCVSRGRGGG